MWRGTKVCVQWGEQNYGFPRGRSFEIYFFREEALRFYFSISSGPTLRSLMVIPLDQSTIYLIDTAQLSITVKRTMVIWLYNDALGYHYLHHGCNDHQVVPFTISAITARSSCDCTIKALVLYNLESKPPPESKPPSKVSPPLQCISRAPSRRVEHCLKRAILIKKYHSKRPPKHCYLKIYYICARDGNLKIFPLFCS